MTDVEILEDIRKIIAHEFQIDEETIEEESDLEHDLNISQVELDDLVAKLEEKYDIQIGEEEVSNFKKVADIVAYLYEKVDIGG